MKQSQKTYTEVLDFWFNTVGADKWFDGSDALDRKITECFSALHKEIAANEYDVWRTAPESALAEVIVLDQFSRNIYRNAGKAFAYDAHALALAQEAIRHGYDMELSDQQRLFLYMPFMHSESKVIHKRALTLFESLGNEKALKYEKIHKDIIDRFGRYPHRNKVLDRTTTPQEKEYLADAQEDFF